MSVPRVRLKYACESRGKYGLNYPATGYVDQGVRLIRTTDLAGGRLSPAELGIYVPEEAVDDESRLASDDLLLSRSGTIGRAFLAPSAAEGMAFAGFLVRFRPNSNSLGKYLYYCTQSSEFQGAVAADAVSSTIQNFNAERYENLTIPLPVLDEQRAIAAYLDRETQNIDELIDEQRGLIKTLRERMIALIESSVTRGVSGARTEPSTIPWLYGGEVASHWATSRIKYMFSSLRAGAMIPSDLIDVAGDYPVYGGNGKRGYTNDFTHEGVHILIGRQGALCGNVHLCNGRFWPSEHAIVGEPVQDVVPGWLEYLLRVMNLGQYSMASAQPGIGVGQIAPLKIPLPPSSEQREIAAYLDVETARIYELISESEELITLSQERRVALITAAVTGQIDVRTTA